MAASQEVADAKAAKCVARARCCQPLPPGEHRARRRVTHPQQLSWCFRSAILFGGLPSWRDCSAPYLCHSRDGICCAHTSSCRARGRLAQAEEKLKAGDSLAALKLLERAAFLSREDVVLLEAKSRAHVALCDIKAATQCLRKALQVKDAEAAKNATNPAAGGGQQRKGAEGDAERVKGPSDGWLRDQLAGLLDLQGSMLLQGGHYESAVHHFDEALKFCQSRPSIWLHRTVAHTQLQRWGDALADLERALFLDSQNADIYVLRAKLYWRLGNVPRGNDQMHLAARLSPEHPEVVKFEESRWQVAEDAYQEAAASLLAGNADEAVEKLGRALELAPGDVKTLVLRAAAHRERGDFSSSLQDIEAAARSFHAQVVEEEKNDAETGGDARGGAGGDGDDDVAGDGGKDHDGESVRGAVGDIPAASPGSPKAPLEHPEISRQRNLTLNAVAVVHAERGNYPQAISLLNKVIAAEEDLVKTHGSGKTNVDPRFHVNRGDCHLAMGNTQEALADLHRAYDADPSSATTRERLAKVHDQFGVALFNDGDWAQAEVEFSTALDLAKGLSPDILVRRGNCRLYQQNLDGAYKDFRAAVALQPTHPEASKRLLLFRSSSDADEEASLKRRELPKARRQLGGRVRPAPATKLFAHSNRHRKSISEGTDRTALTWRGTAATAKAAAARADRTAYLGASGAMGAATPSVTRRVPPKLPRVPAALVLPRTAEWSPAPPGRLDPAAVVDADRRAGGKGKSREASLARNPEFPTPARLSLTMPDFRRAMVPRRDWTDATALMRSAAPPLRSEYYSKKPPAAVLSNGPKFGMENS